MKKSMIAMMAAAAMSTGVFAVQAGEQDTPTKLYNYLSSRKAGDKAALSCYTKATQKSMENFARAKEAAEKRDALTFMRYTTFAYKADAEDAQIQKVVDYYKSMNPEMLNQMMDAYLKTSPVTDMKSEVLEEKVNGNVATLKVRNSWTENGKAQSVVAETKLYKVNGKWYSGMTDEEGKKLEKASLDALDMLLRQIDAAKGNAAAPAGTADSAPAEESNPVISFFQSIADIF